MIPIGNNPNATPNKANVSFLDTHTKANQNINNLKFVYRMNNEKENAKWEKVKDALKKVYPNSLIREFNTVREVNK
ncbi:heme transporter CcmA [Histophilus somni]|uniref:heme transporter CcmA n=1 Tax=Histophilus somni TaxID=731 RepID=UPI0018EB72D0|nr:heme transporter CcmA [Histophilus somni]QQF85712.1 heme transporter CcmA [Histophilus somni]